MGTRLWQDGADQQVFHGLFIPTFARCLSILVESPFLHKGFASSSPCPEAIKALPGGGSDSLGLNESLCGVVSRWLDQRGSLRMRALPSRGSTEWRKLCLDCCLYLAGSCSYTGCRGSFSCLSFSSWDETVRLICGGAIPHNKYRSSTLVGLRHREMALHAAFRTGSIFEACDDLLQTGDAYSAEEKHRARIRNSFI